MTTETTQPDPQVVACPTCAALPGERCTVEDGRTPSLDHTSRYSLAERVAMRVASRPLTVADVPAGQGPASLFLMTRYRPGSTRSHWQLIYKREDGTLAPQVTPAGPEDAVFAVLQHLAATLPRITAEDV